MDIADFNLDQARQHLPRVGLIVLQSDETLEKECITGLDHRALHLFHARIPMAAEVNPTSLLAMEASLSQTAALFPDAQPLAVVAYACTSASTLIGEARLAALIAEHHPQAAVSNPITAVKARLAELGAKRIALLTPYTAAVTQPMIDHLNAHGFTVQACATFNEPQDHHVAYISETSIRAALHQLRQRADSADALVVACTNLRTLHFIDALSAELGVPVVSSNSALLWHIGQLLDPTNRFQTSPLGAK